MKIFFVCLSIFTSIFTHLSFARSPYPLQDPPAVVTFEEEYPPRPPVFLAGVKSSAFLNLKNQSVVSGPPGLSVTNFGFIEWTPPISMQGEDVRIELTSSDGENSTRSTVTISVLKAYAVQGKVLGDSFEVTDRASPLYGYIFRYPVIAPSDFQLWEVPQESLPRVRGISYQLPGGFYSQSDVPVDLYVPSSLVPKGYDLPDMETFGWTNGNPVGDSYRGWSSASIRRGGEIVNGKSYIKFTLLSTNFLIVIAKNKF